MGFEIQDKDGRIINIGELKEFIDSKNITDDFEIDVVGRAFGVFWFAIKGWEADRTFF